MPWSERPAATDNTEEASGMEQNFEENELAEAVEAGYGVKIKQMRKIGIGAQSVNYTALTDDGDKFIVKVVPSRDDARRIISNCRCIESINGVKCLFNGKIVALRGNSVLCLSYCDGREVRFEEYDPARIDGLICVYEKLSSCIQRAENPHPRRTLAAQKELLRGLAESHPGRKTYLAVLDELGSGEDICSGEEEKPLVIHGDFHFANFRYGDTSVSGIFDFMEFRLGYPAEDFIRLVLCSAERLRWYRIFKRGAIMKMFARLVLKTGYPCRRWEEAVDGYLLNKLIKYARGGKSGIVFAARLRMRLRLYRKLKRVARDCTGFDGQGGLK